MIFKPQYTHIIGTGGIGTGIFFSLENDHTLGRDESRLARLEGHKDFCKMHIIMHYVAVLLKVGHETNFQAFPIGAVGDDEQGHTLINMMQKVGMETQNVHISTKNRTLFSVCFQYPDHTGGNITTNNSASNEVSSKHIADFFNKNKPIGKGIILAVPEVPLLARKALLVQGRKRGYLNVASVLSSEVPFFLKERLSQYIDVLAINQDEAKHIAQLPVEILDFQDVIQKVGSVLRAQNPDIMVLITEGAKGSYCLHKEQIAHTPPRPTKVISTAGAGDAFLAGVICGHCLGFPFFKNNLDKYTAIDIGTALAAASVTSADTIHLGIDAHFLNDFL
jgi:sugar/nucleoside kinase (ribokinase family)